MRRLPAVVMLGIAACGGADRNPVVPDPSAPVVVPTAPPGAPTPTPTPTPEPTRTPHANRPPSVSLSFPGDSQCHPHPRPCSVAVQANASDPDGDRLSYSWSGCASGENARADCLVTGPSSFEATVEVSDSRGGVASATIVAHGINLPPDSVFQPTLPPQPSQFNVVLLGNVHDPESGGLCGQQYCLDARLTGSCGPSVFFRCTCLAGAEAEFHTGIGPGVCTLEVRVRDDLGAVATLTTRFEVKAP